MALAIVGRAASRAALDAASLNAIQFAQFDHDEKYHREISRLSVQDRLKHMALHFAKYAGALAEDCDGDRLRRLVADVLIIGVSSSNILNLRLSDVLELNSTESSTIEGFRRAVTIAAGRMAAACEKLDHLEDFPFRPAIKESVIQLVTEALRFALDQGWDVPDLIEWRLRPIKEKSIFHGRA